LNSALCAQGVQGGKMTRNKMKQNKTPAPRYGIHEWFGKDVSAMSADERREAARIALSDQPSAVLCPHMVALRRDYRCAKAGGVCSIRKYENVEGECASPAQGPAVTVCPQRLIQGGDLLRWAGEVLLGASNAAAIKEIPFLASVARGDEATASANDRKAGRIDWVLVDPKSGEPLRWCAVETQAVYFSGKGMDSEFKSFAAHKRSGLPFPAETRRPDYRSSGPKRLAPQLQVKVPELRAWGAKTAVIVDEFFFSQMSRLPEVKGNDARDRLSNAEVVWLVARNEGGRLVRGQVVYARLDESVRALNATEPVSREAFVEDLRSVMSDARQLGKKVFRL
jgi:hypothetical protein